MGRERVQRHRRALDVVEAIGPVGEPRRIDRGGLRIGADPATDPGPRDHADDAVAGV